MVCGKERKDTTLQYEDIKCYSKFIASSTQLIPLLGFAWGFSKLSGRQNVPEGLTLHHRGCPKVRSLAGSQKLILPHSSKATVE